MPRSSVHSLQLLAWLALAFAILGDAPALHSHPAPHAAAGHPHGCAGDPSPAGCATQILDENAEPLVWVPDDDHANHSPAHALERTPCGVCRSLENSSALRPMLDGAALELATNTSRNDRPQPASTIDPSRWHSPRAPPRAAALESARCLITAPGTAA